MIDFEISYWHWLVLAVLLLGIEILAPGFFFLWLCLASFIVGALLYLSPAMIFEIQLLIFAFLSIASIRIWRRYGLHLNTETDHPLLNKRAQQFIGRNFTLTQAIENGRGKVKADGSIWMVEGEDCPKGTQVTVTDVNGTLFKVTPVKPENHTDTV